MSKKIKKGNNYLMASMIKGQKTNLDLKAN